MTSRLSSAIWPVVHDERVALICDLDPLAAAQWRTPSLCPGWDIHDVLAHLLDSAKTTRLGFVGRMVAARFNFDRDNAAGITREKAADPEDTVAQFRAVQLRTATPPAALATRLVEAFVHGEDIRRPLKISRDYPPVHVAQALTYQVRTSVKMGGGKERAHGWRLAASDTAFECGAGPLVRGRAITLLLAVSGRRVDPSELTGPGARTFVTAIGEGS